MENQTDTKGSKTGSSEERSTDGKLSGTGTGNCVNGKKSGEWN